MDRRGFLSFLGAAVAGATLDPERLLWKPGAKLISIPAASVSFEEFSEMYISPWVEAYMDEFERRSLEVAGPIIWNHVAIDTTRNYFINA